MILEQELAIKMNDNLEVPQGKKLTLPLSKTKLLGSLREDINIDEQTSKAEIKADSTIEMKTFLGDVIVKTLRSQRKQRRILASLGKYVYVFQLTISTISKPWKY
jgi:hypothetical protein